MSGGTAPSMHAWPAPPRAVAMLCITDGLSLLSRHTSLPLPLACRSQRCGSCENCLNPQVGAADPAADPAPAGHPLPAEPSKRAALRLSRACA